MNYLTNQKMRFANSKLNHSVLLSLDTVITVSIFVVLLSLITIIILKTNIIVIILAVLILEKQKDFPRRCCTLQIRT